MTMLLFFNDDYYVDMSEIPFRGEIRRDYITGSDVIFTFSRDSRPKDFKTEEVIFGNAENCPFEYGKERLNTTIKLVDDPWKLRLMYNKYPVVNNEIKPCADEAFFTKFSNYGYSYVIVDTPSHNQKFHDIDEEMLEKWFDLIMESEDMMYSDKEIKQVYTFKNSGNISGGSLHHPHTQVIGFTFILPVIKQELSMIKNNKGGCLFEEAAEKEAERTLLSDKNAVAIAPFGSRFRGFSIIMPRRHIGNVNELNREEIASMVRFMKKILGKNWKIFGSHSYDITFHGMRKNDGFHFHIEIVPRFSNFGSMELSGVYLNSLKPEEYCKMFDQT